MTDPTEIELLELREEVRRLKDSNVVLRTELSMIAQALGAEPSFRDAMARVKSLSAKPRVTYASVDEWKGLYVDGKCVMQDHDLYSYNLLEKLGELGLIDFQGHADSMDEDELYAHCCDVGQFPEDEADLKIKWEFKR